MFNECINNRDLDGLSDLMAGYYVFIDSSSNVQKGKELNIKGWADFFDLYPDYVNHFQLIESRDNLVLVIGYSTCAYDPLDGPALWTAKVEHDLIAEWRVYLDTAENRRLLKLPPK
jgi:hypothetical protein